MKLLLSRQIKDLHISPVSCIEWVRQSFLMKPQAQLPPKVSLYPQGHDFFTTMPCILPEDYHRFGVKVIRRINGAVPTLGGDIYLYDTQSGELLAMLDSDWITTMRTGAVATLAIQTFRKSEAHTYGFIGLGNTSRATMLCLLESEPEAFHQVRLFRYKDQAEDFIRRFNDYTNVTFTIVDSIEELVSASDVVVSCITEANELLCPDDSLFRPGCLVVPVHTRGFQNCDLFFDKVFADDRGHVSSFRYFDRFHQFAEFTDVLNGQNPGRTCDTERILCYNIGIGLHDVFFAHNIYEEYARQDNEIEIEREHEKFWI